MSDHTEELRGPMSEQVLRDLQNRNLLRVKEKKNLSEDKVYVRHARIFNDIEEENDKW